MKWGGSDRVYHVRVAVSGGSLLGYYAPKHVSGFTLWELTLSWRMGLELTSAKLLKENVSCPSRKALVNYRVMKSVGIL